MWLEGNLYFDFEHVSEIDVYNSFDLFLAIFYPKSIPLLSNPTIKFYIDFAVCILERLKL